jgi:hypothetical protein
MAQKANVFIEYLSIYLSPFKSFIRKYRPETVPSNRLQPALPGAAARPPQLEPAEPRQLLVDDVAAQGFRSERRSPGRRAGRAGCGRWAASARRPPRPRPIDDVTAPAGRTSVAPVVDRVQRHIVPRLGRKPGACPT